MAPYIWSMGGSFTNSKYTHGVWVHGHHGHETAVTTLVNLLKAGDIGSDFQGGASAVSGETGFPKGEYAMYIDGPWAVPTYQGESFGRLRHRAVPERLRWIGLDGRWRRQLGGCGRSSRR